MLIMAATDKISIILNKKEILDFRALCKQYGFSFKDMITIFIRYGINNPDIIENAERIGNDSGAIPEDDPASFEESG